MHWYTTQDSWVDFYPWYEITTSGWLHFALTHFQILEDGLNPLAGIYSADINKLPVPPMVAQWFPGADAATVVGAAICNSRILVKDAAPSTLPLVGKLYTYRSYQPEGSPPELGDGNIFEEWAAWGVAELTNESAWLKGLGWELGTEVATDEIAAEQCGAALKMPFQLRWSRESGKFFWKTWEAGKPTIHSVYLPYTEKCPPSFHQDVKDLIRGNWARDVFARWEEIKPLCRLTRVGYQA